MGVPEAVRRQAEDAEKALDDHIAQQSAANQEADEAEEMTTEQPGQEPETIEAPPADVQALQRELELERQRTASLKGRIDSQLASANRENKELKTQLDEMASKIDEMAKANAVPGSRRYLSEEEANELGEEVLSVQERIMKGTLEQELEGGTVKQFIEDLMKKSASVQDQQAQPSVINENLFWQAVERYYPKARLINETDQGWFAFLETFDSQSGLKNMDLGVRAIDTGDIASMVDLLNSYKPVQGHVVGNERKPSVKPERTGGEPAVKTAAKEIWKRADVERFFDDVARNRFKGTKEQAVAMENQIMEAAQEGRIVN